MRRIMVLALVAVVVLFAGWYEGLYRPEVSHITSLKANEQKAQVALLTLENRYIGLVKSKKELPQERAALAKLELAVPNDPELDSLVKTLFTAAAQTKVQLNSIGSPPPTDFGLPPAADAVAVPGPAELLLTLEVSGTSGAVENFYRVLDGEPRLFVINNFSVVPGATSSATAAIAVEVFYALPDASTAAS
jgi:Tfp pilus assembly protein PilO